MNRFFSKNKLISLILSAAIIASLLLVLSSCSPSLGGIDELLPKEELTKNINDEKNKDREYVSEYFDAWDFPSFLIAKTELLERIYKKNFVRPLEDSFTLAKKSAEVFLEVYYNEIDPKNPTATTDAIIKSYISVMDDKYSTYRTAEEYKEYNTDMSGSFVGIGVSVTYTSDTGRMDVISVNPGSGAEKAGIKSGDIIIKVDGTLISELGYENAISAIKGSEGTTVTIGIERDGEELSFTVTRSKVTESTVTYEIKDGIAYIKITGFKENTFEQFKKAVDEALLQNAKGIIYDLRQNPGGYLSAVADMLDYIAPEDTVLASFTNNYHSTMKSNDGHSFSLPSVVICDKNTASAAELFTSGVRDFSKMGQFPASIVGETSYGKGIMQDTFRFSDGSSVTMTVAYYNPPLGENYHGKGIEPNVKLNEPDRDGSWKKAAEAELLSLIEKK